MNVLVTGASRGIGRAVATAFAAPGVRVMVNFERDAAGAEKTAEAVLKKGGEAEVFRADVSDPAKARAMVDAVVRRWGRLDVLINNAGVARDRPILRMSEEDWRRVVDVNLSGAFWTLQAAAKAMCAQKGGSILNVASILGVRGGVGCSNYAAAKAGLVALSKCAARELGRFNVRVNTFLPGFHLTSINKAFSEDRVRAITEEHSLGRLPDLDELGRFVVHLSSLSSVSGQVFSFESRVV